MLKKLLWIYFIFCILFQTVKRHLFVIFLHNAIIAYGLIKTLYLLISPHPTLGLLASMSWVTYKEHKQEENLTLSLWGNWFNHRPLCICPHMEFYKKKMFLIRYNKGNEFVRANKSLHEPLFLFFLFLTKKAKQAFWN